MQNVEQNPEPNLTIEQLNQILQLDKGLKVLVYGAKGWLGNILSDYLINHKEVGTVIESPTRVEPSNRYRLMTEICQVDRVVCCVGRSYGTVDDKLYNNIDYLEQTPANKRPFIENIRDNMYAPMLLATICARANKHFLYLGTGCIYDDSIPMEQGKYTFDDYHPGTFQGSNYSIVRGYADDLLQHMPNVAVCRIRLPFTNKDHPRNLITKFKQFKQVQTAKNSMSYINEMFPIIAEMVVQQAEGPFNMTNTGTTSHDQILQMYKQTLNPEHTFEIAQEIKSDAKRCNCSLTTKRLENFCEAHNLQLSSIEDALQHCFANWKHQ